MTRTPNKPNLQLWVDALESGEYKQGVGALADRFNSSEEWQYCCLGVACEVAIKNGVAVTVTERSAGMYMTRRAYDDSSGILPISVADWYGIDMNPLLEQHAATTRNDSYRDSFAKLAGHIRREFSLQGKEGENANSETSTSQL